MANYQASARMRTMLKPLLGHPFTDEMWSHSQRAREASDSLIAHKRWRLTIVLLNGKQHHVFLTGLLDYVTHQAQIIFGENMSALVAIEPVLFQEETTWLS